MSLESWNDGPAREAILGYLETIADVAPADRIAVVDNDGTLWCEKPAYVQAFFILHRLAEQAAADPALASSPVVQALLANDLAGAAAHGEAELARVLLNTHAGITTEAFEAAVSAWLADFASCNYLGFDLEPEIIAAVEPALRQWGTHPSWSRLLGSPRPYVDIEDRLTALLGAPDTLVLPTITHIHTPPSLKAE